MRCSCGVCLLSTILILRYTRPGDIVFDPFAGVGTSIVAAAALGRAGVGLDVDDKCVEQCRKLFRSVFSCEPTQSEFDIKQYGESYSGAALRGYLMKELDYCADIRKGLRDRFNLHFKSKSGTVQGDLTVEMQFLLFQQFGQIVIPFLRDKHRFAKGAFSVQQICEIANSKERSVMSDNQPDMDDLSCLLGMAKKVSEHIPSHQFRATYIQLVDPSTVPEPERPAPPSADDIDVPPTDDGDINAVFQHSQNVPKPGEHVGHADGPKKKRRTE